MPTIRRICSSRRRSSRALAGLLLGLAACGGPPPLRSCDDPLAGVWAAPGGARFHLLDQGARVDGYPIARELPPEPPGTVAAPALLELRRVGGRVSGDVVRRWQRGAQTCVVRAPAIVRGCAEDRLTLQLGGTGAPTDWATCAPTGATVTHLLRRVR